MPNNNSGRSDSIHPVYGINRFFRAGDLGSSYVKVHTGLAATAVAATSAAITTPTVRGIQIQPVFSDGVTSCDIKVFRVDPGPVDTLVRTITGVSNLTADKCWATGAEDVDLKGQNFKLRAENLAGGGTVALNFLAVQ
jgi:hypothetical protein